MGSTAQHNVSFITIRVLLVDYAVDFAYLPFVSLQIHVKTLLKMGAIDVKGQTNQYHPIPLALETVMTRVDAPDPALLSQKSELSANDQKDYRPQFGVSLAFGFY